MAVDDERRKTAGLRRENIIATLSRELDPKRDNSAVSNLRALIEAPAARPMIVSGDIDGIVSAAMLRQAVPTWDAVALIVKSGTVYLHPDVADELVLADCFGVDVYSTYIPNVSNHVALWGTKKPSSSNDALAAAMAYDTVVRTRAASTLLGTPSLWAGIEGAYGDAGKNYRAAGYRYPLGTAQILLAMLEILDLSPRLFDREFLPWLVANCDGGLKTIRDYAHTVPMWWGCLAAAVGPASLSEQIYSLAANQRPTEFVDVVNRLRAEGSLLDESLAEALDDSWNIRAPDNSKRKKTAEDKAKAKAETEALRLSNIPPVVRWISSLSGWPDPFRGGAQNLRDWKAVQLPRSGKLLTTGLPKADTVSEQVELFKANLRESLSAVHTNFAFFDNQQRLNWVAAWEGAVVPDFDPLPDALQPVEGLFPATVEVGDDEPEVII